MTTKQRPKRKPHEVVAKCPRCPSRFQQSGDDLGTIIAAYNSWFVEHRDHIEGAR